MEIKLDAIKGVGLKLKMYFQKAGIYSTYDLLLRRPKKYDHFIITNLNDVKHKDVITVLATIINVPKEVRTKKVHLITCKVLIEHTKIQLTIFNRPYLIHQLKENETIMVKGTYDRYQKNLIAQTITMHKTDDFIKPMYGIDGVHDAKVTEIIQTIIDQEQVDIYEVLPRDLIHQYRLTPRHQAFVQLHLPKSSDEIHQSIRRFKYEEAFFLQLRLQHDVLHKPSRPAKNYDIQKVKTLIDQLPYTLTKDQKEAVNDIFKDFKKAHTTYRLILGDVGSGKTIVAGLAMYAIATAGQQVALMAPTELLAEQHHRFFSSFYRDLKVELLTKSTPDKQALKERLKRHEIDLLIGTHALLTPDVLFDDLGLIIIDEQHKFGVEARNLLIEKAKEQDVIYLSATPIPRTLAMLHFNQADISIIKEKPEQRKAIQTKYLTTDEMGKVFDLIEQTLERNEHIYIVVPAISSTKVDQNIETTKKMLHDRFPNQAIHVMHGKIKEEERIETMRAFKSSQGGILLSTTMIEVGIDIPTATLMVIFSAERFGLAQLHQLRGRIGRSHLASRCLLVSQKDDIERLKLIESIDDGFQLSTYDLAERGPGDFLGTDQSGYLDFKYLNIIADEIILKTAHDDVKRLITSKDFDTSPQYRQLRKYIQAAPKI